MFGEQQSAALELPVGRAEDEQVCIPEVGRFAAQITLACLLTQGQKLEKTIPDAPKGDVPVHLRTRNIFATR